MGALCGVLTRPMLAQASTGNMGTIMETFVVRQFPNAVGHYWGSTLGINETLWDGDEMIVDVHTIMNERRATEPTLSHFLLLLVAGGEIRGVQRIPLEPGADRGAEEEV